MANQLTINWDAVKNMMQSGMGAPSIAYQLKISDSTLYRRCLAETGEEFVELRTKMTAIGTDALIAKGYEMARNGDKTMLIFYLKNRASFADSVRVEGDMPESMVAEYKKAVEATTRAAKRLLDKPAKK